MLIRRDSLSPTPRRAERLPVGCLLSVALGLVLWSALICTLMVLASR